MGWEERFAIVLCAWVPLTALYFWRFGPARGALIGIVGGHVLLPAFSALVRFPTPGWTGPGSAPNWFELDKYTTIGLGLLLGLLLTDRKSFPRLRPGWGDAAMAGYVLYPLSGLLIGLSGTVAFWDALGMTLWRLLAWLPPYLVGRLYFGDREGAGKVAVAIVVATLSNAPVCWFEEVMGPGWFVAGRIYGWHYQVHMVDRLGGWRPEGLIGYGIDLTNWMALGAVVSFGLWLTGAWKPRRGPAWWPALVLVLTTFWIRGAFGYAYLILGVVVSSMTRRLRTPWLILGLGLLVPLYVSARGMGVFDSRAADRSEVLRRIGKEGSISGRISGEEEVLRALQGGRQWLGTGVSYWNASQAGKPVRGMLADGWWTHLVFSGGFVGLLLHCLAFGFVPAAKGLRVVQRYWLRDHESAGSVWVLALFLMLALIDVIPNAIRMSPVALVAGSLVGVGTGTRGATGRQRSRGQSGAADSSRSAEVSSSIPTLVPLVAGLACVLYVFAHAPAAGVAGDLARLIGGLGAALLFSLAGWAGTWASERFPPGRIALYAAAFSTLGLSLNLMLHPIRRPLGAADLLQGLTLAGVVVALARKAFAEHPWVNAALIVAPLGIHFGLGGLLPEFPGSQYLVGGQVEQGSLFPLCPWLTFAVFGPRCLRERPFWNLGVGSLFAGLAGYLWFASPSGSLPGKFPMDLSYALASCAAVSLAFAIAVSAEKVACLSRGFRWLGSRWLVFVFSHFAVSSALEKLGITTAPASWILVGIGSVMATALASTLLAPIGPWLLSPVAWLGLLGVILADGLSPQARPEVVAGVALGSGLVLAAHYGRLAACVANVRLPSGVSDLGLEPRRERVQPRALAMRALALAAILAAMFGPELLASYRRSGKEGQIQPARAPTVPILEPQPAPDRGRAGG